MLIFENLRSYKPFYDGIVVCVSDLLVASLHVEYLDCQNAIFMVVFCPDMHINDEQLEEVAQGHDVICYSQHFEDLHDDFCRHLVLDFHCGESSRFLRSRSARK